MGPFLLSSLIIIIILFAYRLYPRLRYKLPPGPFPLPVLGNLLTIEPEVAKCLENLALKYGQIISVWTGTNLNVVVFSSQLAKEVLKDNDRELAHRPLSVPVDMMYKHGIGIVWSSYGPYYAKMRKIVTHELFSPKRMEALRAIREEEIGNMIKSICRDSSSLATRCDTNCDNSLELRKYIDPVILNALTMLVCGKRFVDDKGEIDSQGRELELLVRGEYQLGGSMSPAEHIWWMGWIFGIKRRQFAKHLARRDRFIRSILDDHRRNNTNTTTGGGLNKPHLVHSLLTIGQTHQLSDDDVTFLIWDLLNTGMDTNVIVIEHTLGQLVKHPRVQSKAQEELDRVIGSGRTLSESDLPNLPYLQCLVKESFRLHPPTPLMLPHRARSNVKIGGFDVPKGTTVMVDVRAVGRDPTVWNDPHEFRPERFLEEDVDYRGTDYRLLPFGAGRRMCPAAVLSYNLVCSTIGRLVHQFSWAPPQGMLPEEIDLARGPGITEYLRTPLRAVPIMRLPPHIY